MKDITIKKEFILHEIRIIITLFALSFLLNVVAIIIYNGSWLEIITQLHYVILIAFVLYLILALFRVLYLITKKFLKQSH
jgi:hypothetical protein